jgi:hypothetical protein
LLRALAAIVLALVVAFQGTVVLAGTTGGINGVVSADGAPLAGARVTVSSPSQQATATTDAGGRFNFLSLSPDTYTISVEKQGYDPQSRSGVTVTADAQLSVTFGTKKSLAVIGRSTVRSANDLVKPGQTADVYSINASTQDAVSGVGGGGGLNNAYSAIATVPGAFVPANQTGYFQTVHIRGGDYDQVGYEVDGIPVNRSFDNYPSGSVSSLGQQELQVYTGATPANAEGAGIAGYINQVIRSGTYPGFKDIDLGEGGPAGYRKANVEFGGATTNRLFSYYVGLGGYNQNFRYVDQFNGQAAGNQVGGPIAPCPAPGSAGVTASTVPTCFGTGGTPYTIGYALNNDAFGATSNLQVRDSIVNLHFGIPHGDQRDDVQLLYVNNNIETHYYSSNNDQGGPALLTLVNGGPDTYTTGYQYAGATGVLLPANAQSAITRYIYPYAAVTTPNAQIPNNLRDSTTNDQGIFKLQYQHNFGDNAYFRLYGYTYYSDWLQDGPNSSYLNYLGTASPDYELSSHTRGISGTFSDQINDKNLLSFQGSFTTANSTRDNNTQMFNAGGSRSYFAPLVSAATPYQGICYKIPTAATPAGSALAAVDCTPGKSTYLTFAGVYNNGVPSVAGYTCGGAPCAFLAGENGLYATYNTVKPLFTSFSLTDEFKPFAKLAINFGLRFERFQFDGSDTTGTAARTFYYNAYNTGECVSTAPGSNPVSKGSLGIPVTAACNTLPGFTNVNLVNASGANNGYNVAQPRIGATYTLDANTVLRGSYGKYAQAPNAAYEQYNTLQNDFPYTASNVYNFYGIGFNTPSHTVRPPVSYNTDFSLERRIGGDVSVKLTPFLRKTSDQIQNFYLNQQTGFVSGLNVGSQTSQGFEFQLNKGSFANNGLSAILSFAYTNSSIKYAPLSNGSTIIDPINNSIKGYNAYTQFCATNPKDSRCGATQTGAVAAPCYTTAGAADPACAAGSIGNPYWTAPVQALMSTTANYVPYDIFPGGIGTSAASFETPYVATLVLNYKKDRFSITPSVQFQAGARYGYPLSTPGVAPDTCATALNSSAKGDPRYFNGSAGGVGYDYTGCGGSLAIPDPYTGNFDNLGSFRQPSQLLGNLQLSYRASKNVTFVATFANVFNQCFGGSQTGFTWLNGPHTCSYSTLQGAGGGVTPVGNQYNPTDNVQTFLKYPYAPNFGAYNTDGNSTNLPFSFYIDAKIRL